MGEIEVHALRGISLTIRKGEFGGHHGNIGFGKIDDDEHLGLPRPAYKGLVFP